MRQIIRSILVLATAVTVSVCSTACGGSTSKNINDYFSISVPEDCYQISSEDMDMALSMYSGMAGDGEQELDLAKASPEMLTELFGVKNLDELKRLAVAEMTQHRIVEYIYEFILDDYSCSREDEAFCDHYLKDLHSLNQQCASLMGISYETYISEYCGMTVREYETSEKGKAKELCVMRHLLDAEGIRINDKEIQDAYDEIAEDLEVTAEEVRAMYLPEEIEYSLAHTCTNDLLAQKYSDVIENASREQAAALGIA